VKLLFDQNLAPRLRYIFQERFPGSAHVRDIGLRDADDRYIWDFAAANDFALVTKDADFRQRSFLEGHPPKIIWVRSGNCSTAEIEALLRRDLDRIIAFLLDPQAAILMVS
jgi:predicted nuclease of predicted toxin-antitoxin system